MARILAATLVTAAASMLSAQTPPARPEPPAAIISGRVLTSDGDPLRNARIRDGANVVLSDAAGGFELRGAQSRRPLTVSKAGYATREVAPVSDRPLVIRLQRGAVITGRILDVTGDAVADLAVQLRRNGGPAGPMRSVRTDDLGEYRFGSLAAGTYSIAPAGSVTGGGLIVGPGFAPPVQMRADVQTITLVAGEEKTLDFTTAASTAATTPLIVLPGAAPIRGSAIVQGRVVARDGHPIAYAHVRLDSDEHRIGRSISANVDGGFDFTAIPSGHYHVSAVRSGYSDLNGPTAITVKDGGNVRLNLVMDRDGAIAGVISDEAGEPLQGVTVQALRATYQRGQRQLTPTGPTRVTDDRGAYRLFGLKPGDYVISAAMSAVDSDAVRGYVRSYFPGTDDATQAQFVTLAPSRLMTGTNIWLARARTASIRGRILDAGGAPTSGGRVALMPRPGVGSIVAIATGATLTGDGHFEFRDVAPGQYLIVADRGRLNASREGEFGSLIVTIDGRDLDNLVLQMAAGATIRGHLTIRAQNSATAPPPSDFAVSAVPAGFDDAPSQWASARPGPDGLFDMRGVHGSRRLQVLDLPTGWIVESIRVNGFDVTDMPIDFGGATADVDVIVTDRAAAVFGSVADGRGRAIDGARIVFFPTGRDERYSGSRYFARATSQADGTFSIAALPAGHYYAIAVSSSADVEDGWQDPQWLEMLEPRARAVTLTATGTISVRLIVENP